MALDRKYMSSSQAPNSSNSADSNTYESLDQMVIENRERLARVKGLAANAQKLADETRAYSIQMHARLNQQSQPIFPQQNQSKYGASSSTFLKAQPYTQQQTFSAAMGTPSQIASTTYSARR